MGPSVGAQCPEKGGPKNDPQKGPLTNPTFAKKGPPAYFFGAAWRNARWPRGGKEGLKTPPGLARNLGQESKAKNFGALADFERISPWWSSTPCSPASRGRRIAPRIPPGLGRIIVPKSIRIASLEPKSHHKSTQPEIYKNGSQEPFWGAGRALGAPRALPVIRGTSPLGTFWAILGAPRVDFGTHGKP